MARSLPWGLWFVAVGLLASGIALLIIGEPAAMSSDLGWLPATATVIFVLAFCTVGALIGAARPENPVGWILLAAGLCFSLGGFAVGSVTVRLPGWAVMGWLSGSIWTAGIGLAGTFLLLLFPHGRLPSSRWRPAAWLAAGGIAAVTTWALLPPLPSAAVAHPLAVELDAAVLRLLGGAGLALMVVSVGLSVASVVVRFRRSSGLERLQLKWLAFSAALVGAGLATSAVLESLVPTSELLINVSNAVISLALATVPMAAGVAILRHRLYEIDRLISRTVSYALLTLLLGLTYLIAVYLLQRLLAPLAGESQLAVAGSTLLVAALFGPLRRRVQARVDRRFNRVRYDAQRTVDGFRARLRETVDLDELSADLLSTVGSTVQPTGASLWLRPLPR